MTLPARTAVRAALTAARQRPVLAAYRPYSDSPYPFTKPTDARSRGPIDQDSRAAYPFTKPSDSAPVAPPTRPTGRPGPLVDNSAVISREAEDEGGANRPDYGLAADYRTSSFSTVPIRIQDGSEPMDFTPAAVLSGAPTDLQGRTVRIYKPAKTATQSGDWHGHHWLMDWDVLSKGHRWENPLMGWQSSADAMQATHLGFKTKEDAIRFAQKQGYEYFVQEPNHRRFMPKAYASQFEHSPKKLKQIRTK